MAQSMTTFLAGLRGLVGAIDGNNSNMCAEEPRAGWYAWIEDAMRIPQYQAKVTFPRRGGDQGASRGGGLRTQWGVPSTNACTDTRNLFFQPTTIALLFPTFSITIRKWGSRVLSNSNLMMH
jgi:hypothetical protein